MKGLPRTAVEDFPPSDVEEFCRAMELPPNCKLPVEAREVFACVKESYRDSDVVELTSGITAFFEAVAVVHGGGGQRQQSQGSVCACGGEVSEIGAYSVV